MRCDSVHQPLALAARVPRAVGLVQAVIVASGKRFPQSPDAEDEKQYARGALQM